MKAKEKSAGPQSTMGWGSWGRLRKHPQGSGSDLRMQLRRLSKKREKEQKLQPKPVLRVQRHTAQFQMFGMLCPRHSTQDFSYVEAK